MFFLVHKHVFPILIILCILLNSPAWAKSKTYAGTGALIGGLSGTAIGGITSLAISPKFKCSSAQRMEGEPCWLHTTVPVATTIGSAVVGAGLGLFIGSLILKQDDLYVLPALYQDKDQKMTGGAFVLNKSF